MGELTRTPPLLRNYGDIAVVDCSFAIDPIELDTPLVRLDVRLGIGMCGLMLIYGAHGIATDQSHSPDRSWVKNFDFYLLEYPVLPNS